MWPIPAGWNARRPDRHRRNNEKCNVTAAALPASAARSGFADPLDLRFCAGRRPRHAADAAYRLALQTGRPLWRQVPHHRLHLVQLRQFRHPAHRRCNPVWAQSLIRHQRLEFSRRPFPGVRRHPAGAAAGRRKLVPRHRRCGVPEPRRAAPQFAALRPDPLGRPYLPWTTALAQHVASQADLTVACIDVPLEKRMPSAWWGSTTTLHGCQL